MLRRLGHGSINLHFGVLKGSKSSIWRATSLEDIQVPGHLELVMRHFDAVLADPY
jgi:hypothetical protein